MRAKRTQSTPTDNNDIWNLQGTLRDNYTNHEPMAMFPDDASSTQPNGTQTQEQIMAQLAEVMDPAFLGLERETGDLLGNTAPIPPTFEQPRRNSIPWSDFIRTQTVDGTQVQPTQATAGHGNEGEVTPERPEMERLSQCSRSNSPDVLHDPPTVPDTAKISTPSCTARTADMMTRSEKPSSRQSSKRQETPTDPSPQLQRKKRKSRQPVASDDYLEDIGLPPEQYKPRPSRSRSAKSTLEEPIDYSVIPEKAAKKPSRKTRTATQMDRLSQPQTPQKVPQICDMGFSPSTTRAALERHGGDVNLSIEWLVTNAADKDADELAASPAKSKRVKPNSSKKTAPPEITLLFEPSVSPPYNKIVMESPADVMDIDTAPPITSAVPDTHVQEKTRSPTSNTTSATVQVVIPRAEAPPSEPEEPQLKPDQEKTANLEPDVTAAPTDNQPPQVEQKSSQHPTPKPKRARGRPKKAAIAEAPDKPGQIQEQEAPIDAEKELKDEKHPPAMALPTITQEARPIPASAAVPAPTPAPASAVQIPEKPVKPLANPASSAKRGVPYRVGLSKRARIQPLLRIMKK